MWIKKINKSRKVRWKDKNSYIQKEILKSIDPYVNAKRKCIKCLVSGKNLKTGMQELPLECFELSVMDIFITEIRESEARREVAPLFLEMLMLCVVL